MANPQHHEILKQGINAFNRWRRENKNIVPDLTMADFSNTDFDYVNLSEANLSKAKFSKSTFRRADLRGTDLSTADLSRTNFNQANLRGADLSRADLSRAYFAWANLRAVDLKKANLIGAYLRGATLTRAKLIKANLSGANLRGANLFEANLSGANLREADLRENNLSFANLSLSDISGANITDANLHKWDIQGIKCTHIIWKEKRLEYTNPDAFEKDFTKIESIIEILLNIPFSDLSHIIGRIIEYEVNQKFNNRIAHFNGQTAISNDTTKFNYLIDPEKYNEIYTLLSNLNKNICPVTEDLMEKKRPHSIIRMKDDIDWQDIVFWKFPILKPEEMQSVLIEQFDQMQPFLQKLINAIQTHIRR